MTQTFALTWPLSEIHGWGLVGVHTALHLVGIGRPPLLLDSPHMATLRPENRAALQGVEDTHHRYMAMAAVHPDSRIAIPDVDVLHALANGFVAGSPSVRFRGRANIGVIAFEDTAFDEAIRERARAFDRLVVHSTYNRDLLADQGFDTVGLAFQGVDPTEIRPLPPTGRFGDRFVVFSGGKLEFRKGQDLVLTAFGRFLDRHPEALLVTAWQSPWPAVSQTIAESRHTRVPPQIDGDGRVMVAEWAGQYGIPAGSVIDLGMIGRAEIAPIFADCHAAVFPNRCEGATNLVAMEAMGCGVPVILSANTGHHDLIGPVPDGEPRCWALTRQAPLLDRNGGRRGWAESSVEEIVMQLEAIHSDREEARARADRALAFIHRERSWSAFAKTFTAACTV